MALSTRKDAQTKKPKPFRTLTRRNRLFLSSDAFPDIHQNHHDLLFFSVAEQIIAGGHRDDKKKKKKKLREKKKNLKMCCFAIKSIFFLSVNC